MMVVVQLGVARGRQVVQRGTVTRPQCTQQFGGCQFGHVLADQTHQQRTVTYTYLPLQHDQRTSDPRQQQTVATQIVDDESVDVSAVTAVYVSGSGRQVTGPVTAVCIGILLVSRRHAESKKSPRPVGVRPGSDVKRRCVRPSVAVLQQFTSHAFNKCYVGNVIHRRLHCVIFSPVQSIPNAVRATRPLITLMAVFGSGREVTGPLRVCSHIALARPPSADDERTTSARNKRRTATTSNDAPARCCPRRVAQ